MNRRSFLRGLFALPCSVGLLARSLALQAGEAGSIPAPSTTPLSLLDYAKAHPVPAVAEGIPINHTEDMKVTEAYVSSDQTSIWQVEWFDLSGYILPDGPLPVHFADPPRNWLKESIRGN